MSSYLEDSLAQLKIFEGVVQWMYLDTVGKVTVGVGLMLPTVEAAVALPFQFGDRAAVAQEISADFRRVTSMAQGKAAGFYRSAMSTTLLLPEIDSLLRQKIAEFEAGLQARIATYDALPSPAKLVLIDMAYNLGIAGLLKGYPKMMKAIVSGDWATAAAECFRNGPGPARNNWTKSQLLAAGAAPPITASADVSFGLEAAEITPIEPAPRTTSAARKRTARKPATKPVKKAAKKTAKKAAVKPVKKTAKKVAKKKPAKKIPAKKAAKKRS